MRFYNYIIYRLYNWRLKQKDNTPEGTVVIMMSAIHTVHLITIKGLVYTLIPATRPYLKFQKEYYALVYFVVMLLFYLFIYNKEKWKNLLDKYKDESIAEKRKGSILVVLFTWGSFLLLLIVVTVLSIIYW